MEPIELKLEFKFHEKLKNIFRYDEKWKENMTQQIFDVWQKLFFLIILKDASLWRFNSVTEVDILDIFMCSPLDRITLCQHKSDNINRMIQLTDCVLLRYIKGPAVYYYNMCLIILSMIQISGGHCIFFKLEMCSYIPLAHAFPVRIAV